jgi:hypothetical protein
MSVTACSGSGINSDGFQDNIADNSDATTAVEDVEGAVPADASAEPTAYPALDCLVETCDGEECRNSSTCVIGLVCMAACGDAACAEACVAEADEGDQGALQALLTCATDEGCFGAVTSAPECGDLTCGEGEDAENCPADCQGAGTGCLEDRCELGNCLDLPDCAEVVVCMGDCPSVECAQGCIELAPPQAAPMLQAIVDCGKEAACFGPLGPDTTEPTCGDDACDASEACGTCPADCGACPEGANCCTAHDSVACSDGECTMSVCSDNPSCCADSWSEACAEIALTLCDICQGDTCGNGACEASEDAMSCPEDCEDGPPTPPADDCLDTSCDAGNCADFPECDEALSCMNACTSEGCAQACIDATPGIFQPPLTNLLECGLQAGCFGDSELVCGDGWCIPPESAASCPEDCAGGPACGNGVCSGGEGCNTCPADCGNCDGPCCSPHDDQGCGNSDCQAAVCAVDQGCCYDNWSWECAQLAAGICPACSDGVSCGDGECAPSENSVNCPEDCSSPANDFLSCMYGVCEEAMDICFDDAVCEDAFPCLEDCVNNGGTGCTGECMPEPESDIFMDLGLCGGQNGCGNICGDGFCGPGETNQGCPEDCTAAPPVPDGCSSIGATDDNGEFILCTDEESWVGAKDRCVELGGLLASIRSVAESQTLAGGIANTAWIGFNDFDDEGSFEWLDGTAVTFTNWNAGEPNDYGQGEDCTEIIAGVGSNVWNDANCNGQRDFICRVGGDNPGTDPGDGPGPGDGDDCAQSNCEIGWLCQWGGCEDAIACIANCDSSGCAASCVEGATGWQQNALQEFADCADAAGCF